jgi:hypothetical protein
VPLDDLDHPKIYHTSPASTAAISSEITTRHHVLLPNFRDVNQNRRLDVILVNQHPQLLELGAGRWLQPSHCRHEQLRGVGGQGASVAATDRGDGSRAASGLDWTAHQGFPNRPAVQRHEDCRSGVHGAEGRVVEAGDGGGQAGVRSSVRTEWLLGRPLDLHVGSVGELSFHLSRFDFLFVVLCCVVVLCLCS